MSKKRKPKVDNTVPTQIEGQQEMAFPMMELRNYIVNPVEFPDGVGERIVGEVFGNPLFEDGATVRTSYIVKRDGDVVTTFSGSVYRLVNAK